MANIITLSRFPLLAIVLALLFGCGPVGQLIAVPGILLLMLMDCFDGMIARRYNESSLLGSALDVAADRSVELVLWVAFFALGMISLIIPLVVIVRGTLTDAIRAVASSRGIPPFAVTQSRAGRFLVGSPVMRTTYALVKGFAFCTLALVLGLSHSWGSAPINSPSYIIWTWLSRFAQGFSWTAFALCLLRGLPVFIEGPAYLRAMERSETKR